MSGKAVKKQGHLSSPYLTTFETCQTDPGQIGVYISSSAVMIAFTLASLLT